MFGIFMFILDLQYIIYKYIYTTIQKFGVCHVIKSILKKIVTVSTKILSSTNVCNASWEPN